MGAYDVSDGSANAAGLVFDNLSHRTPRQTATADGAHPCMENNHMSETTRVSYDSLLAIDAGWAAYSESTAKIGADKAKGIPETVEVVFKGVTFNVNDADEATEAFNTLGADVFNGLLNYAADLKLRARSVQAKRAELTNDPFKKEAKMVAFILGEDKVEAYLDHRRNGLSKEEAAAQAGA